MEYYTATIKNTHKHNKIESQKYFELKKPNTKLYILYYFI